MNQKDELVELADIEIKKYQGFLNKLQNDLEQNSQQVQNIAQKIHDYGEVEEFVKQQYNVNQMSIGGGVFVQVEQLNPGWIALDMGLGVVVDCKYSEVPRMCSIRVNHLGRVLDGLMKKQEEIETYIEKVSDVLEQVQMNLK